MEEINTYLEGENQSIREEYLSQKKKIRLQEKNKIYNKIHKQNQEPVQKIEKLIKNLEETDHSIKEKEILQALTLWVTYVKRKSNFYLLEDDKKSEGKLELDYAIKETLKNQENYGIKTHYIIKAKEINIGEAIKIYDQINQILEKIISQITIILINIKQEENIYFLTLRLEGKIDEIDLAKNIKIKKEDHGQWIIETEIQRGNQDV